MFRNPDDQSEQNDRQHHVRFTQRLLGVEGEEEYFVRLEVERVRKAAGERSWLKNGSEIARSTATSR